MNSPPLTLEHVAYALHRAAHLLIRYTQTSCSAWLMNYLTYTHTWEVTPMPRWSNEELQEKAQVVMTHDAIGDPRALNLYFSIAIICGLDDPNDVRARIREWAAGDFSRRIVVD